MLYFGYATLIPHNYTVNIWKVVLQIICLKLSIVHKISSHSFSWELVACP